MNHRGTEDTEKRDRGNAMNDERDPVTQEIIGAAIEVHRIMGPGLLESVYQRCLEKELKLRGLSFIPQARLPLSYKGEPLGEDMIMDFYLPEKLIVELKAVENLCRSTTPN